MYSRATIIVSVPVDAATEDVVTGGSVVVLLSTERRVGLPLRTVASVVVSVATEELLELSDVELTVVDVVCCCRVVVGGVVVGGKVVVVVAASVVIAAVVISGVVGLNVVVASVVGATVVDVVVVCCNQHKS